MLKLSQKKSIQKKADYIREKFGFKYDFQIDLESLLNSMGYNYREQELDSISGLSFVKNGEAFVVVNQSETYLKRRRFTIAHELGHLELHHNRPISVSENSGILMRDMNSSIGEDLKEIEANYFAACLLMPSELISSELKNHSYIDEDVIVELARKFNVSSLAMTIRLTSLGYF